MRSFFAQQDHLRVLNYVIDCLDFMSNDVIAVIGTSDQSCWLAEACIIRSLESFLECSLCMMYCYMCAKVG